MILLSNNPITQLIKYENTDSEVELVKRSMQFFINLHGKHDILRWTIININMITELHIGQVNLLIISIDRRGCLLGK